MSERTWRPASGRGGWYPKLSPDGRYVLYGFWQVTCADLSSCRDGSDGVVTCDEHAVDPQPGVRHTPVGWWSDTEFLTIGEGVWEFYLTRVGEWQPRFFRDARESNFYSADDGHVYFGVPGSVYDGQELTHGGQSTYGGVVAGSHLATMLPDQAFAIGQFTAGALVRALPPSSGFTVDRAGDLATGYNSAITVAPWGAEARDETVTPWRRESVPCLVRDGAGALWIWTATSLLGESMVLGRRLGEREPIVLRGFPAEAPVARVWTGDPSLFVVAGNSSRGELQVRWVPASAPRERLAPRMAPFPSQEALLTFYQFSTRYGSDPNYPANATIAVTERDSERALIGLGHVSAAAARMPIGVDTDDAMFEYVQRQNLGARVLLLYIGDTTGSANAERMAADAKARWRQRFSTAPPPVLWYVTRGDMDRFEAPPSVDIYGPEFYLQASADIGALDEQRWRLLGWWMDRLPRDKPWIPVCQAYDRNGTWGAPEMRALAALQPAFLTMLATPDPRIRQLPPAVGLAFFAVKRPGGAADHAEIREWHAAMLAALPPGLPAIGGTMSVRKPAVTITEPPLSAFPVDAVVGQPIRFAYANNSADGDPPDWVEWQHSTEGHPPTTVARNPGSDPDHHFSWDIPGTFYVWLRAGNAGGVASTGTRRPVRVSAPQPPPEPPEPPEPPQPDADVPLPTYDEWIKVEGPAIDAAQPRASIAGAAHTSWRRLNENWSLDNILRDILRKPTIDLAQRQRLPEPSYADWMNVELQQIAEAIRSTGRAPNNGDVRHNAWRRFVERWRFADMIRDITGVAPPEPQHPEPPQPQRPAPSGVVRGESRRFIDDAGWWPWRGVSDFGAIAYVLRGRESELVERLDAYADGARTVVRCMGMLGDPSWANRGLAFSPQDPGYWEAVDRTAALATARGMRLEFCLFADAQIVMPSADDRRAFVDAAGAFIRPHGPAIIPQLANEPFKNGWSEADDPQLIELADRLTGLIEHRNISIGDPIDQHAADLAGQTADRLVHLSAHANISVIHPDRGQYGDTSRFRRWIDHLEGFSDVVGRLQGGGAFVLDEPMGAGPYQDGRRDDDPDAFIAAMVVAAVVGFGYTYHWIVEGPSDNPPHGFTARTLPGLAEAAAILPRIPCSPDWQYKNDSWAGSPTEGISWRGRTGKLRHLVNGRQAWSVAYGEGDWDSVKWRAGFTPREELRRERVCVWSVNI